MTEAPDTLTDPAPLRLKALDAEDLAVISAHLQGASVRVGDMAHQPKLRRFVLALARFDWTLAPRALYQRCGTGLHFDGVHAVKRLGFAQDRDLVLTLQALVFVSGEAPAGTVVMSFEGGGAIRLDVECLEASLGDIGPRWSVEAIPTRMDGRDPA